MAGKEGFEPPRAVKPLLVFKTSPFSQTWVFALLVVPAGLEPATYRLWAGCSNQLSYRTTTLKMNNFIHMVAPKGVEPLTFRVWTGCSNQLSYSAKWWRGRESNPLPPACKAGALAKWATPPINGEEDRIWTCDHLVPNQVLCQAELLLHFGKFAFKL